MNAKALGGGRALRIGRGLQACWLRITAGTKPALLLDSQVPVLLIACMFCYVIPSVPLDGGPVVWWE